MRHRQRHVHATIFKFVRDYLDVLGWMDTPAPFGTTPVTMMDYEPQQAGETPAFNTVAISIGHTSGDEPFELGAGLQECRYTVFIDVYGEKEPIGVAIADDIKDALNDNAIALRDFTGDSSGVVTDAQIEFEDLEIEPLTSAASTLDKRSWRAVKVTACCYF